MDELLADFEKKVALATNNYTYARDTAGPGSGRAAEAKRELKTWTHARDMVKAAKEKRDTAPDKDSPKPSGR